MHECQGHVLLLIHRMTRVTIIGTWAVLVSVTAWAYSNDRTSVQREAGGERNRWRCRGALSDPLGGASQDQQRWRRPASVASLRGTLLSVQYQWSTGNCCCTSMICVGSSPRLMGLQDGDQGAVPSGEGKLADEADRQPASPAVSPRSDATVHVSSSQPLPCRPDERKEF